MIRGFAFFVAGIVSLGALLDARSNAIALSDAEAAGLAAVLVVGWAVAELRLRRGPMPWRAVGGTPVAVTRLGWYPRLALTGALGVLLYSRVIGGLDAQNVPPGSAAPTSLAAPSTTLAGSSPTAVPPTAPAQQRGQKPRAARPPASVITDIVCEARLTCTLNESGELPPNEVEFMPIGGGSDATLSGAAGKQRLQFVSPVRFREHSNSLTVINRFGLPPGAELRGRPLDALRGYAEVVVPIVTVVYGDACGRMRLLEVSIRVNGEDLWYGQWRYDVPFQQGPTFTVPLAELHARLTGTGR